MFELIKVVETAKSESNKALRFFYLYYVREQLKRTFFNKFDIYNMERIKEPILEELYQLYHFENDKQFMINRRFPYIVSVKNKSIIVSYQTFHITVKIVDEQNYMVEVLNYCSDTYQEPKRRHTFDLGFINEIIFMAIYNYCVSYVYGKDSKLYKDDKSYIEKLNEMF